MPRVSAVQDGRHDRFHRPIGCVVSTIQHLAHACVRLGFPSFPPRRTESNSSTVLPRATLVRLLLMIIISSNIIRVSAIDTETPASHSGAARAPNRLPCSKLPWPDRIAREVALVKTQQLVFHDLTKRRSVILVEMRRRP